MAVFVTCGYQQNWCDFAQSRLHQMGVQAPIVSSRSSLGPSDMTAKICNAHRAKLNKSKPIRQLRPGKTWQMTSADIFVENAELEMWGWASPQNIFLLDFWREFDPACIFILVYGAPADALSFTLAEGGNPDAVSDHEIAQWRAYNDEVLRFYQAHPDRALLVHIDGFDTVAERVTDRLTQRFQAPVLSANAPEERPRHAVYELIAEKSMPSNGAETSLLAELENAADVPAQKRDEAPTLSGRAWQEYRIIDQEQRSVREVAAREQATQEQLLEEIAAQQSVNEALHARINDLERQIQSNPLMGFAGARENEALLKQLGEAQDELELYFNRYSDLKQLLDDQSRAQITAQETAPDYHPLRSDGTDTQDSGETPWLSSETSSSAFIDFRSYLDGDGWYTAEQYGRWAGPSHASSIHLPTLHSGRYTLQLKIVDAMSPDIARGLKLTFDGEELRLRRKILADIGGRLAPLRRFKAQLQNIPKPYPVIYEATVSVPDMPPAGSQHILWVTCPDVQSPWGAGEKDTRLLSVYAQTLAMTKKD